VSAAHPPRRLALLVRGCEDRAMKCAFLLAVLLALAAGRARAAQHDDLDPRAQLPLAESHTTAQLSPTNARRLFVLDTAFPAAEAAKTYVLNGTTGAIEGMFNQAYWPNFAVSPDGTELYAVDSYWEKHTRGKRSDYIVVRDARTLEVKEDIPLPAGRLLVVSKKYNFDVTPDGRYGFTYNLAPSTAVTVTDLKARTSVGTIGVAGCGLVFAQAPNRFSSLCADGSILTATFDESAQASIKRAEKVFDAKNDPAFEHSAWDKKNQMLYLITYQGDVVPVSLAADQAAAQDKWSLTTQAERAAGWRPGGWQVSHFHSAARRLYVLMHVGRPWTHKNSGSEVWEFDAVARKRLQRIKLKEPAQSVAVSPDSNPLVYVIADSERIEAYTAASGKLLYRTDPLGFTPQLLTVWGD
jgi:methylamine dehydrogenase heavy chain